MKKTLKYIFLFIFVLPLIPLSADEVRVTPLDYWKGTSSWNDNLTVDQLIEASVHASGVEQALPYVETLKKITEDLGEFIIKNERDSPPEILAEVILNWMHEHILTGRYITDQTKMTLLLDKGDYNCVSSAVLYLILTRSVGLNTMGEETRDHAFCTLRTAGDSFDVETTTIMGFDPGSKKEFDSNFEDRTGFAYVRPGNYSKRQSINDKKLISLILQNRLAFYQQRMQYDVAVGIAVDRWFFYPTDQHEKDMNDSFRNWVSALNKRGEYVSALDFLLPLSQEMGFMNANKDLIGTLIYNQTVSLTNDNRLTEARTFLGDYNPFITSMVSDDLKSMIATREIEISVENDSYEVALTKVRKYKLDGLISQVKANELLTYLHQNRAIALSKATAGESAQDAMNAYLFLSGLPREEADLPGIRNHGRQYLNNWAVFIHNEFVIAANSKQYEKAKQIITEALAANDSSPLLKDDLEKLEKIMNK
jgi:hypothetical protein